MPRVARRLLVEKDSTNHCTWRAHNLMRVFDVEGAREHFLEQLGRHKATHGMLIHSYTIMGTHPHVLCRSTKGQDDFSMFWQKVDQSLAKFTNDKLKRKGQVVMERMVSPRIQRGGRHMMVVMQYIERNPVRAGLVRSPKDWKYSSYRHFAFGEPNPIIDDPPEYLALGRTPAERQKAYRALFARSITETLGRRRPELVVKPFFGDAEWMKRRREAVGLRPAPD